MPFGFIIDSHWVIEILSSTGHKFIVSKALWGRKRDSCLSVLQQDDEYKGWAWAVIDIDVEPFMGKSAKLNVTLPRLLTKKIDDQVKAHPDLYSNRSNFLQLAAAHELNAVN